jgi:hypothetical protein
MASEYGLRGKEDEELPFRNLLATFNQAHGVESLFCVKLSVSYFVNRVCTLHEIRRFITLRFRILTVLGYKITGFSGVMPYSVVDVNQRFGGTCCLHRPSGQIFPEDKGSIILVHSHIYKKLKLCATEPVESNTCPPITFI